MRRQFYMRDKSVLRKRMSCCITGMLFLLVLPRRLCSGGFCSCGSALVVLLSFHVGSVQICIPILLSVGCILRALCLPTMCDLVGSFASARRLLLASRYWALVGMFYILQSFHFLCIVVFLRAFFLLSVVLLFSSFFSLFCSLIGWAISVAVGVIVSSSFCSMLSGWWILQSSCLCSSFALVSPFVSSSNPACVLVVGFLVVVFPCVVLVLRIRICVFSIVSSSSIIFNWSL